MCVCLWLWACLDRCRSDTVGCFDTKITHAGRSHICPCQRYYYWLLSIRTQLFVMYMGPGRTDLPRSLYIYSAAITTVFISCQVQPSQMEYIRGQLCGFNYPSGHRGPDFFQDFSMNAYKEHRKTNKNKTNGSKGQIKLAATISMYSNCW